MYDSLYVSFAIVS